MSSVGRAGFLDIASISKSANKVNSTIYAEEKKEYDKILYSADSDFSKCTKCGEEIPAGIDNCPKCDAQKNVHPAYWENNDVIHIRDGYEVTKEFSVLLVNHELGHKAYIPRCQYNSRMWFNYLIFKFNEMYKLKHKRELNINMKGYRILLNLIYDVMVNYIQVNNVELNQQSVFGDDYAWKMIELYQIKNNRKIDSMFDLCFRLNRAVAQEKLNQYINGELEPLIIDDKEEEEKLKELFAFLQRLRRTYVLEEAEFKTEVAERFGWFLVEKEMGLGSRPKISAKPMMSKKDFIETALKENKTQKQIDEMIKNTEKAINWF